MPWRKKISLCYLPGVEPPTSHHHEPRWGSEMDTETVGPVIIVGGGPVGLAASLELARFHVPTVVLEQRASTSWHPKTRNVNTRTMEIARGWGTAVYERLRGIDTPEGWKSPIRFLSSAVGEEYGSIETKGFLGPGPDVSPALPVLSSQDLVEKILCDAALASGLVDLRFGHQALRVLHGWQRHDVGALVEVVDKATEETYTLTGAALVAADGVDSLVRGQLGVALVGEQSVSHFVNCYFRADIEPYVHDRPGILFFIVNERAVGVLQPLDARGRWLCQISVTPEQWSSEFYTRERCEAWVRDAVGVEDLDVEVVSLGRWRMNATVAERLVHERVVLCGDAAHQFPPTGGLGVNTGLQGMHNAMWKLAFCVRGRADWSLLETYDVERRPVAHWTAEQSLENYRNVARIGAVATMKLENEMSTAEILAASRRYGNHLGVELGSAYTSSAVISDGSAPPTVDDDYSDYEPSGTPGCRAPHAWLGSDRGKLSTLDLFGPGFTVLTGPEGEWWRERAAAAAEKHDVPIAAYAIGAPGLQDSEGVFFERYGIDHAGAVLVRPDGYVAWRSSTGNDGAHDTDDALGNALAKILGTKVLGE